MATKKVEVEFNGKDNTGPAVQSAANNIEKLKDKIKSVESVGTSLNTVKNLLGGMVAAISVASLDAFVRKNADAASKISDSAHLAGITAEEYQKLGYVAQNSGSSIDVMGASLIKINEALAKASAGDKKASAVFAAFGVDPKQVKDSQDALMKMADAVKQAGESSTELAKLEAHLSKLGIPPEMVQTFQLGAEGIKYLGDEAERLGMVVDNDTIASLEGLGDVIANAEAQSAALSMQFAGALAPALLDIGNAFIESGKQGSGFKEIGEFVGDMLKGLAIVLYGAIAGLQAFGNTAIAIGNGALSFIKNKVDAFISSLRALYADAKKVVGIGPGGDAIRSASSDRQTKRIDEFQKKFNETTEKNYQAASKVVDFTRNVIFGKGGGGGSKPPAPTRPLGTQGLSKGGGKKGGGGGKEENNEKAEVALAKAEAEAVAAVKIATEKNLQEDMKRLLDQGKMTYADYYKAIVKSQETAIDIKLEALRQEVKEEQKIVDSSKSKEADRLKAKAKIAKLNSEILIQEMERKQIAGKAAAEQEKSEDKLAQTLLDVQTRTKEILGTMTSDDRAKLLAQKYKSIKEELMRGGISQDDAIKAELTELAKENFDAGIAKIGLAKAKLEADIAALRAREDMTSMEIREGITKAHEEAARAIDALMPSLEKEANYLGGEYLTKLQDAKTGLVELKKQSDALANEINKSFTTGLADAIYGVMTGEKSPAQALKDLFKGVGNSIARMVADDLASDLYKMLKNNGFNIGEMFSKLFSSGGSSSGGSWFSNLFSGGGGGGGGSWFSGIGNWFSGLFGYSEGGYTGQGPVSAPAGIVHRDEYVFSAPSVRTLGVDFLESLHSRARAGAPRTHLPGFADGGYTGSSQRGNSKTPVVQMTVVTQDAASFKNSSSQIEARMAIAANRALRRNA